jgi:hypothetical protein
MWEGDLPPRRAGRKTLENDTVAATSVVLTIIAYAVWLVGMSFALNAGPQQTTLLDLIYGKVARASWDASLFTPSYVCWSVMFGLEAICIFITRRKLKRPTDRVRKWLIYGGAVLAALSFATLFALSSML